MNTRAILKGTKLQEECVQRPYPCPPFGFVVSADEDSRGCIHRESRDTTSVAIRGKQNTFTSSILSTTPASSDTVPCGTLLGKATRAGSFDISRPHC